MDLPITPATHAQEAGDPLGALNWVITITLNKTGEATTDLPSRMRKYLATFGC